jgi:hypothetical protein
VRAPLQTRRPIPQLRLALVLALIAQSIGATAANAKRRRHPPTFAGLKSATTCHPGPAAGGQTSSFHLEWEPATDRRTQSRNIVYEIYQASVSGGENFATPTYTSAPGATSFNTPQVALESTYFVVRARDRARLEDTNTVELQGENLCV